MWGDNSYGQIGINSYIKYVTKPTLVTTNVKKVTTSGVTAFATKKDNTVWGWGSNSSLCVGNGSTANVIKPVKLNFKSTLLSKFDTFTVNSINKNSTSISGKGLKTATVKAYVNGKQIGKTATVDSKGNYKLTIPKQKSGTKVAVKMSKSGYVTIEKSIKVK